MWRLKLWFLIDKNVGYLKQNIEYTTVDRGCRNWPILISWYFSLLIEQSEIKEDITSEMSEGSGISFHQQGHAITIEILMVAQSSLTRLTMAIMENFKGRLTSLVLSKIKGSISRVKQKYLCVYVTQIISHLQVAQEYFTPSLEFM